MNEAHIFKIAGELKVQPRQVAATAKLFADGATVPFIARYRKEATGSLDEVAITSIRDRLLSLAELDQRREAILKSLAERNLLTDELKNAIAKPRPSPRSRISICPTGPNAARARPSPRNRASNRWPTSCSASNPPPIQSPRPRLSSAPKRASESARALAGARDILAERISDDALARARMRELFWSRAVGEVQGYRPTRRRRAPNSRITSIGANRSPTSPPIGCWPCAVAKARVCS